MAILNEYFEFKSCKELRVARHKNPWTLARPTMPKYVVISNHPPMSCPSANKALRGLGESLGKDLPPMLEKHKVKLEVMLHLDPGHKVLWVVEAPSAEAVRDFVYDAGLGRWNDFEFFMASSLEDVTAWITKLPTIW
jgi:hypothetical protein